MASAPGEKGRGGKLSASSTGASKSSSSAKSGDLTCYKCSRTPCLVYADAENAADALTAGVWVCLRHGLGEANKGLSLETVIQSEAKRQLREFNEALAKVYDEISDELDEAAVAQRRELARLAARAAAPPLPEDAPPAKKRSAEDGLEGGKSFKRVQMWQTSNVQPSPEEAAPPAAPAAPREDPLPSALRAELRASLRAAAEGANLTDPERTRALWVLALELIRFPECGSDVKTAAEFTTQVERACNAATTASYRERVDFVRETFSGLRRGDKSVSPVIASAAQTMWTGDKAAVASRLIGLILAFYVKPAPESWTAAPVSNAHLLVDEDMDCPQCGELGATFFRVRDAGMQGAKADTWGSSDRAETLTRYQCQKCGYSWDLEEG